LPVVINKSNHLRSTNDGRRYLLNVIISESNFVSIDVSVISVLRHSLYRKE